MDTTKAYNTYESYPLISYNCIKYLMDNNELVWKLLKYTDNRPYEKSNLTKSEKGALIYGGQPNSALFNVFMDFGADDSITNEVSILRISPLELVPNNYVWGSITLGCEVYVHYKINTMSNYQTRCDTIIHELIKTFNGAEISGVGKLFFDASANSRTRVALIGAIPMKGKLLTMGNISLG